MQGTNPITMLCTYSTPCGWCCKWDKKCDKKIGCSENKSERGLRVKVNPIDDVCDVQDYIKQKLGEPREDKSYIYF